MDATEYTREPNWNERNALREAIWQAARTLAFALEPPDAPLSEIFDDTAPDEEQARVALAMVRALTIAAREIEYPLIADAAREAGHAGASYADIGEATGISRQAARSRWPGAVAAGPGRPRRTPGPAPQVSGQEPPDA